MFSSICKWFALGYCTLLYRNGWLDTLSTFIERYMQYMGPTFVKSGQILAQRVDMLPVDLIECLQKLYDRVPADESITKWVQKEYAYLLANEKENEITLLGSGSLSQVYRCGSYAIKVRRPSILEDVEADYAILKWLLWLVYCRSPYYSDIVELVEYLKSSIYEQCDFISECKNQEIFVRYQTSNIHVPKTFPDLCTENVIVMEYIADAKPLYATSDEELHDLFQVYPDLPTQLCQVISRTLTFESIFHGDLHPGNVFVAKDGLYILDFGWCCHLDEEVHDLILDVLDYYHNHEYPEVIECVSKQAFPKPITSDQKEVLLSILTEFDKADSLVPLVNRIVQYSLDQQLHMKTKFLHILIARVNGYHLFGRLHQDQNIVLEIFQENMFVCHAMKFTSDISSFFKSSKKKKTNKKKGKV